MINKLKYLMSFLAVITFVFIPFKVSKPVLYDNLGRKIEMIIIDAGHGGKDPGTVSLTNVYEKDIALAISFKLKEYISAEYDDIQIYLTRDKDEFIDLKTRGKLANDKAGSLFISVHCNAKKNEENDKSGFEIYVLSTERLKEAVKITNSENQLLSGLSIPINENFDSLNIAIPSLLTSSNHKYAERLAGMLQTELIKETKLPSRGVFQAGYYVLVSSSMPAVLIECGYLSNKSDEEYLISKRGQEDIARGIYKSIRFFKYDFEYENNNTE